MISIASSLRFREVDSLPASFDNTQFNDEVWRGGFMHRFTQSFYDDDTVTIQVKVLNGYTIDLYYSEECWGPWTKLSSGTKEVDGGTYDYWEVTIDFSGFSCETIQFQCYIYTGGAALYQTWRSEPVKILTEADDSLLQVEFFNQDNAFEVDYSTEIAHLFYVPGILKEYRPAGEMSILDNQDEVTKIRDEVKRVLILKTEPIPRYFAEMIRVAIAHDRFYINEVEFVADSLPEVENNQGNLVTFSCNMTQANVIGLNTHDIGFDVDSIQISNTMVLQEEEASGSVQMTIPEGYLLATITGYRTAGSPTIKAGTTPGGDEVLAGMSLNATDPIWEVATINSELAPTDDATLYVTISGAGATANLYVLLINNREA